MALSTRFLAEKEQMLAHLDVLQELYPSLTHEQYDQELELMLPHNYGQLAVFDDEHCVAICGFWIGNKLWIGKYLELDNIVVCEAHRSKGLGEQIMGLAKIRKIVTIVEDTHEEAGQSISPPTRRAAAVAVIGTTTLALLQSM